MSRQRIDEKHEADIARDWDGYRQPGSGSKWNAKGDVKTDHELVECKATRYQSISVHADIWAKIHDEASTIGKRPVYAVRMKDAHGNDLDLVILSKADYEELR